MLNQRSELRYMCAELVSVMIHRDDGRFTEAIANLEDISYSGACIQFEEAICVGTNIEVLCATCGFRGTVRYCRPDGAGYDTGIAFDTKNSWDPQQYEPEHLLPVPMRSTGALKRTSGLSVRKAGASDLPGNP